MKYQLEITTLLVPVNVHQLFEKCEWPELNCFDHEKRLKAISLIW